MHNLIYLLKFNVASLPSAWCQLADKHRSIQTTQYLTKLTKDHIFLRKNNNKTKNLSINPIDHTSVYMYKNKSRSGRCNLVRIFALKKLKPWQFTINKKKMVFLWTETSNRSFARSNFLPLYSLELGTDVPLFIYILSNCTTLLSDTCMPTVVLFSISYVCVCVCMLLEMILLLILFVLVFGFRQPGEPLVDLEQRLTLAWVHVGNVFLVA